MGGILERMETVTDAAGALLELQEVIESCLKQTNPADVWDIDDDEPFFELKYHEENSRQFLESFDHEELMKKLHKAHTLIAEAELKMIAYRLETNY